MSDILEPPFLPVDPDGPSRSACRRHASGHAPHQIQVGLAVRSPEEDWRRVVIMGAVGDVVVLDVDGELRRYRNHETDYLMWVVRQVGAEAELNVEYNALFLRPGAGGGRPVFSLQRAEEEEAECHLGSADGRA